MILVAGLSPALSYCYRFRHLKTGAVNRALERKTYCGGKAVNAALALGSRARLVTPVGGRTGREFAERLRAMKLAVVPIKTTAATRVCITVAAGQRVTELVEEAPPLSASELRAFELNVARITADAT